MEKIKRRSYPTDLTDKQWEEIAPLFVVMRNRKWEKRELVHAVLYLVDSGCKWKQLPHDFPNWKTVYSFFSRANVTGLWDRILKLLVKVTRKNAGKDPNPTYALIDSQSIKTTYASEHIDYDKGKKRKDANVI